MTQHRKRLKKLMQSIDVQRNDFNKELWCLRNYNKWDYQTIKNWAKNKYEFQKTPSKSTFEVEIFNQDGSLLADKTQAISEQSLILF